MGGKWIPSSEHREQVKEVLKATGQYQILVLTSTSLLHGGMSLEVLQVMASFLSSGKQVVITTVKRGMIVPLKTSGLQIVTGSNREELRYNLEKWVENELFPVSHGEKYLEDLDGDCEPDDPDDERYHF